MKYNATDIIVIEIYTTYSQAVADKIVSVTAFKLWLWNRCNVSKAIYMNKELQSIPWFMAQKAKVASRNVLQ